LVLTNTNEHENKSENVIVEVPKIDSNLSNDSSLVGQTQVFVKASEFVEKLKNKGDLSSFFNENWTLIYHEDNRCEGSTDGQLNRLKSTQIESTIKLSVKNDGDGWECDKKKPKKYVLDFDLKDLVIEWERFEIPTYEKQDERI
jgi:hypothetical protein